MSQFTDIMKGNASWLAHGIAVCQDDFELLGHEYQELMELRAQYEENTRKWTLSIRFVERFLNVSI